MDYGILIGGLFFGAGIAAITFAITTHYSDKRASALALIVKAQAEVVLGTSLRLTNLRRNAFLTNEHGHRVRYHKASAEVRARAEAE